jgi:2-polyprenyl-3-methyl-5-hydroxy-6-metoxy-1,4-benzoquinol methylase
LHGGVTESEAWNAEAHEWVHRIREGMGGRVHAHDASVHELLPPPEGLTVDAGCGEGRLTRELTARGYDVVGFDGSAALVAEARAADPGGRYEVATLDALPLDAGAARLVVCVNVVPHVDDLDAVAQELARVVAFGGALLVGTIHPVGEAGEYDEEADELRLRHYFEDELHAIPLGEHEVHHRHRTIEGNVRPFIEAGFALVGLREVPGPSGSVPLYLDLLFRRVTASFPG